MFAILPTLAVVLPLALGTPSPSTAADRAEVARIQRHFDGALVMLADRDISKLSATQRAHRAELTTVLRAYRDRGLFPRNYDFPSEAMPYFIDRRTGVLCAVAHLMESTGKRALVEAVADADNNVWVPELAGNAEFRSWLDDNGLTIEEAARIQVPYIGPNPPVQSGITVVSSDMMLPISLLSSVSTAALVQFVPQLRESRPGALLSFAAGTFAMAGAAQGLGSDVDQRAVAVTVASGVLNYYMTGRALGRYRAAELKRRANISPIIPVTREQGAGIMLSVSF